MRRQSHWGSWSSWGSLLIALSLGFTVIRVLFRFLIEKILFRFLSDRVFFESSETGSSSLGHAVINSSLHQCSFSAMSLFFYQIVLLLFKSNFCFAIITLTCFIGIVMQIEKALINDRLHTEAVVQRCSVKKAPATLLKKRLWHRSFPVNFAIFLRTPFFIEHLWWLLF